MLFQLKLLLCRDLKQVPITNALWLDPTILVGTYQNHNNPSTTLLSEPWMTRAFFEYFECCQNSIVTSARVQFKRFVLGHARYSVVVMPRMPGNKLTSYPIRGSEVYKDFGIYLLISYNQHLCKITQNNINKMLSC